jgi:hypothetical protein
LYGGNAARELKSPAESPSAVKQAQSHASPVIPQKSPIQDLPESRGYDVQERYQRIAASNQTLPNKLAKKSPVPLPGQGRSKKPRPTSIKRNTFQIPKPVPTHEDYPDLPALLFTSPKSELHNALQRIADTHSEFTQLGSQPSDWFRCTFTCVFLEDGKSDSVIGEGLSKVMLTDGSFDGFSNGI